MVKLHWIVVALSAPMAACPAPPSDDGNGGAEGEGEGEGEGEDACPVSPLARELLEQTVNELFTAGAFATTSTHGGGGAVIDLGYAADLVGLDVGVLQVATLAFPCTEPTLFDPTCEAGFAPEPPEDPFFEAHDRCFRLGCVDVDTPLVDVYFTMRPTTAAEERHAFTTPTTSPQGTSSYAQNPLVRWVADLTVADTVGIHADVDVDHVFTDGEESVDLSHAGTVDGTYVTAAPDDLVTLDITLTFADLAVGGVIVEVHGDEAGALTGGISLGATELATLDGEVVAADVGRERIREHERGLRCAATRRFEHRVQRVDGNDTRPSVEEARGHLSSSTAELEHPLAWRDVPTAAARR